MLMIKESRQFTEVKSKQFALISSAGLAIPSYEMTAEHIHMNIATYHKEARLPTYVADEYCAIPPQFHLRNSIYDA